jgi:hypothetical protein
MLQIIIILLVAEIVVPLFSITLTPPIIRIANIIVYAVTIVWVFYSLYHGKAGIF